ncbi:MAG: DUF3788 domain-containing protein [Oscillospiraceae bacterium]|jgi:hypothetical protein|nr:DUF3788 domain-containing protein [Oscillospiraceae bacterium]
MELKMQIEALLGQSTSTFYELLEFIRQNYVMDELWNEKNELKFRRGGKTFVTLYIKEGCFTVLVIFGKAERAQFELSKTEYSDFIYGYYDASKTYHDGKWMFIDIKDNTHLEEIKKLILIKKRPNKRP